MDFLRGNIKQLFFAILLPVVAGADALWLAMPITELVVAIYVAVKMRQSIQKV